MPARPEKPPSALTAIGFNAIMRQSARPGTTASWQAFTSLLRKPDPLGKEELYAPISSSTLPSPNTILR